MGADYYRADTENGDYMDDPSEDGLLMLLEDLNLRGNTVLKVSPAAHDSAWSASVKRLPIGTYELERSDPPRGEHHRDTASNPSSIARNLTIWLAARSYPHRP